MKIEKEEQETDNCKKGGAFMNNVNLIDFTVLNVEDSKNGDLIKAKKLQQKGYTGKGVTIAVIDTGCDYSHPSLKSKIVGGRNFTNEGSVDDYMDFNGHGTHVAGIIAGEYDGVAKGCNLLILKVLTKSGAGSLDGVISAINYAVEKQVDIINMSLGSQSSNDKLYEAVKKAVDKGILVCCASGNSGDGYENTDENDYPGSYPEVISVGAMDMNLKVTNFSNSNIYVDIIAPGENITSEYLNGGLKSLSGTSMACPCVSGCLALLIEWSKKEFKRKLSEAEMYGVLMKNTITLKDVDRRLQGQGRLEIIEDIK